MDVTSEKSVGAAFETVKTLVEERGQSSLLSSTMLVSTQMGQSCLTGQCFGLKWNFGVNVFGVVTSQTVSSCNERQ